MMSPIEAQRPLVLITSTSFAPELSLTDNRLPGMSIALYTVQMFAIEPGSSFGGARN